MSPTRTLAAIPFERPLLYARVDLIHDDDGSAVRARARAHRAFAVFRARAGLGRAVRGGDRRSHLTRRRRSRRLRIAHSGSAATHPSDRRGSDRPAADPPPIPRYNSQPRFSRPPLRGIPEEFQDHEDPGRLQARRRLQRACAGQAGRLRRRHRGRQAVGESVRRHRARRSAAVARERYRDRRRSSRRSVLPMRRRISATALRWARTARSMSSRRMRCSR